MAVVNIIVPVYNAKEYLAKCIRSLQNQTIKDIEIFLIDDGSTDGSSEICDEFAKKDPRIRVVHKSNGGAISARNVGIEMISEEGYTTFCDADDYMPKKGIEILYQLAKEENADIASGTLQRFFRKVCFIKKNIPYSLKEKKVYEGQQIVDKIIPSFFGITDFPGYMPTKLYKNTLLKKSKQFECPVKHFQEDIAFNLQMCFLANRIAVSPDTVYYYRMGGGTSRFMPSFLEDCASLYTFKIRLIDEKKLPENLKMTSSVEMINELWFWLNMYYQKYEKCKGLEFIKKEIERCCVLSVIQEAITFEENEVYGEKRFFEMVNSKNVVGICDLLYQHNIEMQKKHFLKKIILGI